MGPPSSELEALAPSLFGQPVSTSKSLFSSGSRLTAH